MRAVLTILWTLGCTPDEPTPCADGTVRERSGRCLPVEEEDLPPIATDTGESGDTATPFVEDPTITKLVAGIDHTCALRKDGLLNCWGRSDLIASTPRFPVLDVTAQGWHTCVVDTSHRLICWGDNAFGQSTFPTEGHWQSVSAGVAHTCALEQNGSVTCWGVNDDDPLFGHGQVENRPSGSGYRNLVGGKMHSCALDADDAVVCWGPDDGGVAQLHGDPVDVGQVTGHPDGPFQQITTEYWGGCGLDEAGTVTCWGLPFYAPGDDFADYSYSSIDGGGLHSCGLRNDGGVTCWGDDDHDQVSTTPEGEFVLIGVGEKHACAVDAANTVTCWGRDRYGEATPP